MGVDMRKPDCCMRTTKVLISLLIQQTDRRLYYSLCGKCYDSPSHAHKKILVTHEVPVAEQDELGLMGTTKAQISLLIRAD